MLYSGQYKEFAYYYDVLMRDIDYKEWSNYILKIIKRYGLKHEDILEMACGTGNIAVDMAESGFNVTAFDMSEDMLSIAFDKALKANVKINFLMQDMRDINIPGSFGIILCLCDSINYITKEKDLQSVFKWVYNHLKDGGVFIFDINSLYKLREIIGNNTFTHNEEDLAYIWENSIIEEDRVEFYLTFFVRQGELYKRFDEIHIEKIYETEYIIGLLTEVGFTEIIVNDAFTFDDIRDISERVNFTVRK